MSEDHNLQPVGRPHDMLNVEEPACFLTVRQIDLKPLLNTLAALCVFFGALAVITAFGAMLVIVVKNFSRLF